MRVMQFAEKPSIIVGSPRQGKPACVRPSGAGQVGHPLLHQPAMSSLAPTAPIAAVLDTNVVLDLWLFDDPRAAALRAALQGGQVQALLTAATLAELAAVLQRPFTRDWPRTPETVQAALAACGRTVAAPLPRAPLPPRCSDADDQKFVDLAWCTRAAWLFSRDRAVLKLARAARAHGLCIAPPEAWATAPPPQA